MEEQSGGGPPPATSPPGSPSNGRSSTASPPGAPLPAALCLPASAPSSPGPQTRGPDPVSLHGAAPAPSPSGLGIDMQGDEYWLELDGQNQVPAITNEVGVQSVIQIVDWDALQIEESLDEEGRLQVASDKNLYDVLGLKGEDERAAATARSARSVPNIDVDLDGADIVVDDFIPNERVIVYDPNKPEMKLGALFPTMEKFKLAVRQYAINEEFELDVRRSSKERYDEYCLGSDDCTWQVHGRTERRGGQTIIVTAYKGGHTCTSSMRRLTTTPSAKWVASKVVSILMKNPYMRIVDMQKKLQDDHKCTIGYDTVWRGVKKAMNELYGSWEESFGLLYSWKAEVLKKMPGSVIEIDIVLDDGLPYFRRFFCALRPCIEGFLEGCRPYLSIDSTTLNGRWCGHLASACGIDGHNWMYPVAFGFIDSKSIDNWTWWIIQLNKALGDLPLLAVYSDACKGLGKAVKYAFPMAEQRECFRHLMNNCIKKYKGAEHMYPAARAYRKEVYDYHIAEVKSDPVVEKYLDTHHKLKWMRSAFNPAIKCDYVTNNIAEVFNNWIKDIKDKPVCELADLLREQIMILWHKRRRIGQRMQGKILPAVIHVLKAQTRGLGHLSVVHCDHYIAQVVDISSTNTRHVVRASLHECSCEEWKHTGKPCQHALALITAQPFRDVKMEDFVNEYYSVEMFKNAYKRLIQPLPDKSQWPKVDLASVLGAPLGKRGVGHPRKNRIKGALEGDSSSKKKSEEKEKKRIRGPCKCKKCGDLGHRESSSKCPFNGTKKRKRKPRKNSTKNWSPAEVSTPTMDTNTNTSPGRSPPPLMEDSSSAQLITHTSSPTKQPKKMAVKKITPKKKTTT